MSLSTHKWAYRTVDEDTPSRRGPAERAQPESWTAYRWSPTDSSKVANVSSSKPVNPVEWTPPLVLGTLRRSSQRPTIAFLRPLPPRILMLLLKSVAQLPSLPQEVPPDREG